MNKSKKQIYDEILQEMPVGLNEKEMAAFIMKKIALERSFSSKYYWGTDKTRKKIYELCINGKSKSRENKRQLICVTATKMYNEFAKSFDLDCYIIGDTKLTKDDYKIFETGEHISPVIKTKCGKYIKCDVEWDLENIQTGRKWIKFGTKDTGQDQLHILSQDEIDNIMQKIGYINNNKDYLENYIEHSELLKTDTLLKEKIDNLFSDKEITKRVSSLKSSVDIYRFYRRIIKEYITKDGITLYGGYSENKNRRKYTILAHNEEGKDDNFWIWSNKNKQMVEISKASVKQFIDNDFIKFVPGKNKEKYDRMISRMDYQKEKIYNNNVTVNDIWTR